jgi:hypothetical protein
VATSSSANCTGSLDEVGVVDAYLWTDRDVDLPMGAASVLGRRSGITGMLVSESRILMRL